MEIIVVDHPLVQERLTWLRDEATRPAVFRSALREVSSFLIYEAIRDVASEPLEIRTPLAPASGFGIERPPLVVPILRAALGMLDAALALLPKADVGFLGVRRNEETHEPEPYLQTIPDQLDGHPVLLLDPMLATGGSLAHACSVIKGRGAGDITAVCILCAPEGIKRVEAGGLVTRLVTAAVDIHLDENAFIVPGLGDAGDRQFGEA